MKGSKFRNPLIASEIADSKTLLHSRYSLSKDEGRVILMCSERMKRDETLNKDGEYWFTVSDYCDVFNITRSEALKDIKEAVNKLSERWIQVKNSYTGDEISMRWIGKKMRNVKQGKFGVVFWPELLPYLYDLSDQLNSPLAWLADMNNESNRKFLRWINEAVSTGETELLKTVDEIRYGLDIREVQSYKIYNNLKRRLIEPAIKNINDCTTLNVKFEELKVGRKVNEIRFTWTSDEILQSAHQIRG
jgi:plasmid replication initiation protein